MYNIALDSATKYIKEIFDNSDTEVLRYHNFYHTQSVLKSCREMALESGLSEEETKILEFAAIFHDVGYIDAPENHEEKSADLADAFLRDYDAAIPLIEPIKQCILATKRNWKGDDKLCLLMRDADMSGLSKPDFFEVTEDLRVEQSLLGAHELSRENWDKINVIFFEEHDYISEAGKKLYKKGKRKNLKKLKTQVKKAENDKILQTISSSRSAQNQLKTALRNHIDLSAIADNKANIMLTINALAVTVGIPILLESIKENPLILYLIITLGLTNVVSMIFATMSTRPAKNMGKTTMKMIEKGKSNLFFFGNFHKMSYSNYEEGIKKVIADNEILESSIIRDLYFLGKSLGRKFDLLRYCYNSFMIGIIILVLEILVIALV